MQEVVQPVEVQPVPSPTRSVFLKAAEGEFESASALREALYRARPPEAAIGASDAVPSSLPALATG